VLRDFLSDRPQLTIAFVSRFLHQVRQAAVPASSLTLLEHWISEEGLNAEEASSQSTQRLALTQITMANSITSLLAMARMDWRVFVEDQSVMEAVLRRILRILPRMTFATRDHLPPFGGADRQANRIPEETVARSAIDLAETERLDPAADPREARRVLPRRRRAAGIGADDGLLALAR
jgi:hypothetical protein